MLDQIIDVSVGGGPVYAIFNRFYFKKHCDRMRAIHPAWSQRQVECCLYWQGTAKKELKFLIWSFLLHYPNYVIVDCPEAAGVNVTETMKQVGIKLEWPPVNYTYQIVLAGIPIRPADPKPKQKASVN